MPIFVADGRARGQLVIDGNATVYEMNPWELGTFDPTTYAFAPMRYLGSNFSDGVVVEGGVAQRVVEGDALAAGVAYAREFTVHSLPVLALDRDAVGRALDTPLAEGLRIEADLATLAFQTRDAAEGMAAFMEKRKPKFGDG